MSVFTSTAAARLGRPRNSPESDPFADTGTSPLALAQALDHRIRSTGPLSLIDQSVQRWVTGEHRRTIVVLPAQEGKTTLARYGVMQALRHDPESRVAVASYSDRIARRIPRWVRNDLTAFPALGLRLAPDQRAAHDWRLANGVGGCYAAGTGGSWSGVPVDRFVIDDVFKDRAEADSEVARENVWGWWTSTATARLSEEGSVLIINCLAGTERVLMGDGRWRRIDEVKPGDAVVSLAEDRTSVVTAKVTNSRLSGYSNTVTVRTERLSLTATPNHPIATLNRDAGSRPDASDVTWVRAGDLKPGDIVVSIKALPEDHIGVDLLPDGTEVTEDLAWFLGYMLGDGWVTAHVKKNQRGKPTAYAVCVAKTKSTKPHKADLDERVLAAFANICPNKIRDTGFGYFRADWNAGGRMLHPLGYGAGARGKRVPDCVFGWSVSLRRAYIRGYAEADGSLQRTAGERGSCDSWRIGSMNRDLLCDIRYLALTCGYRSTMVFTGQPMTYQPPNSPRPITSVLCSITVSFTDDAGEGRSRVKNYAHPDPRHIRYERVREVTRSQVQQPVYDLTVEGTEAFVAEGFAVHNTRWHHDDLIGRLLEHDPDGWHVVHIPAQADPEVLDPDPLDREPGEFMESARGRTRQSWEKRKREADDEWEPVYQGNPAPPGGRTFDPDKLRKWSLSADGRFIVAGIHHWQISECRRFVTVDTAQSTKTGADFTVASAWAVPPDGTLVLLDARRKRVPDHEQIDLARPLAQTWTADAVYVESTMAGTRLIRDAISEGLRVDDLKADRSKTLRAALAAKWVQAGRVWFPTPDDRLDVSREPLASDVVKELRQFPNGRHDDFVDTLAYAAAVTLDTYLPPDSGQWEPPVREVSAVDAAFAAGPIDDLMGRPF